MDSSALRLKKVEISGFKSVSSGGQGVQFGDVTILLGANGSGKSNLVSFFKLLNFITTKGLQVYIGKQGGADALLHYGSKKTDTISFNVQLEQVYGTEVRSTDYAAKLVHGMPDRLFFASEKVSFHRSGEPVPQEYFVDSGNGESGLPDDSKMTSKVLFSALAGIRAYQFHDTSETAKIKSSGYIDDSRYLRSDAGNLAAFLRAMTIDSSKQKYYDRIVRHIRNVMPQFKDFELTPSSENKNNVRLNWYDSTGETLFGPHQISDGSLRFMALTALLLQPPAMLPNAIVIDEPELGLHPAAIAELAGMIKTASRNAQIIVATQSTRFVDEFSASDVVIVERDGKKNASVFKRLDIKELDEWLSRYSLSELWEKNVLGGRP